MNEQERFGQLIRQGMERRGITGKELAAMTGWSQSVVSDIVRGDRATTPPDVARTLSEVLGIPRMEMAVALGYLEPEQLERGVAYVIHDDDPLVPIIELLENASPAKLDTIHKLVTVLSGQLS